jgi:hypothetical protein
MFMNAYRSLLRVTFAVTACAFLASAVGLAQGRGTPPPTPPKVTGKPTTPPGQGKPTTPPSSAKTTPPKAATAKPLVVKPALAGQLQPLLPPNTDIALVSQGFRNLGQFVAAVHVSNNLNIPFDTLRTHLVTDNQSLGQAIKTLKPDVDANGEALKAERQARDTIARSNKNGGW